MTAKKLNKQIAQNVKAHRKRSKLSQERVAKFLGMTRVNYVNMEAGRQNFLPLHIYNLCQLFNCRPTNLFPKSK